MYGKNTRVVERVAANKKTTIITIILGAMLTLELKKRSLLIGCLPHGKALMECPLASCLTP